MLPLGLSILTEKNGTKSIQKISFWMEENIDCQIVRFVNDHDHPLQHIFPSESIIQDLRVYTTYLVPIPTLA